MLALGTEIWKEPWVRAWFSFWARIFQRHSMFLTELTLSSYVSHHLTVGPSSCRKVARNLIALCVIYGVSLRQPCRRSCRNYAKL